MRKENFPLQAGERAMHDSHRRPHRQTILRRHRGIGIDQSIQSNEIGVGLAVLSRYACALEFSSGRLVELDVRGFPIRRDWHIVHLRRRKLPSSVTAFIQFLKDMTWLSRNGSRERITPPTD